LLKDLKINGFIRPTFEPNISIDIIKKYFTKLKDQGSNQIEFLFYFIKVSNKAILYMI